MPKSICFYVTEIAGLIDKNPHQNQDEQIHHFMNRIIDNKKRIDMPIPKRYLPMIQKNIDEQNPTKVQKKIKNIQNFKCSDDIKNEIKKKIYTERGKLYEDHAIIDYQKETDLKIQTPKDFIKRFYIQKDTSFYIGGRIDGLMINDEGDTIIVEVKNRQNRIFSKIPEYEKVQLECYARMMKAKECVFIQRYNHENHIEIYKPNDKLWNEILSSLAIVTSNVNTLLEKEKSPVKK